MPSRGSPQSDTAAEDGRHEFRIDFLSSFLAQSKEDDKPRDGAFMEESKHHLFKHYSVIQ